MTTLDVPCDGRATFHRLNVRALLDSLLADEARVPHKPNTLSEPVRCAEIVATFLRSIPYMLRGIGT